MINVLSYSQQVGGIVKYAVDYPPQEVIDKLKESTYREVQQILSLYI